MHRFLFPLVAALTCSVACSDSNSTGASSSDSGAEAEVGPSADAGDAGRDGASPTDTASDVSPADATSGASCTFNRECLASDRCECLDFDCRCRPGARGAGKNGIDTCTAGEDCASSICAEGSDGKSYCSDECATDATCGPALPRCLDIAGLGRVCARKP